MESVVLNLDSHAEIAGDNPRKTMNKSINRNLNPFKKCPDCGGNFVEFDDREYIVITLQAYICENC